MNNIYSDSGLVLNNVTKWFNDKPVLHDISLHHKVGDTLAFLGPSGCGKTTLLRIIAGIEIADSGSILWNGQDLAEIPPHKRNFGLMFQEFALFPHMTVEENIGFGLRMKKLSKPEITNEVNRILEIIGLSDLKDQNVDTLSGGEKQRVALARSIAPKPEVLMLDEPLGSLDRSLRDRLLLEIKGILSSLNQTTVYVTHDQEEAFSVADKIVVMNEGKLMQVGTPNEIFLHPDSIFVARFLGFTNLIDCTISSNSDHSIVHTKWGNFTLPKHIAKTRGTLLIRPDYVEIATVEESDISGIVIDKIYKRNLCILKVDVESSILDFILPMKRDQEIILKSLIHFRFTSDSALQII